MSTYASLYFRPGMNSLQYPASKNCGNNSFTCYKDTKKIFLDNGIVNPAITQSQRAAQIINNSIGGNVQFGNSNNIYSNVTFLGKTEGQPGGLNRPLKNKF